MLYLTCTTITSVDLAHYGLSRAKDWVSVDCGTKSPENRLLSLFSLPVRVYMKSYCTSCVVGIGGGGGVDKMLKFYV